MKNKTKDRLELVVDIAKNLPGASLEVGAGLATLIGIPVGTIGAGIAYLCSHELAKELYNYTLVGIAGIPILMCLGFDESRTMNIIESIEFYKDKQNGKIDVESLKFMYQKRKHIENS